MLGDPVNYTDPSGLDTKICSRALGSTTNPDRSVFNPISHQYLVVDEKVYSFQAGEDGMLWSQGKIDRRTKEEGGENPDRDSCVVTSIGDENDKKILDAINKVGETKYNIWAYPGSITHALGARNCQSWARDVLGRAYD